MNFLGLSQTQTQTQALLPQILANQNNITTITTTNTSQQYTIDTNLSRSTANEIKIATSEADVLALQATNTSQQYTIDTNLSVSTANEIKIATSQADVLALQASSATSQADVLALQASSAALKTVGTLCYTALDVTSSYNRWLSPFPIDGKNPHGGLPGRWPVFADIKLGSIYLILDTEAHTNWTTGKIIVKVYKEPLPQSADYIAAPTSGYNTLGSLVKEWEFSPFTATEVCNGGVDGDNLDRLVPNIAMKKAINPKPLIPALYNIQVRLDATATNIGTSNGSEMSVYLQLKRSV